MRAGQREAVLRGERTALKEALTKLGAPNLPTKACRLVCARVVPRDILFHTKFRVEESSVCAGEERDAAVEVAQRAEAAATAAQTERAELLEEAGLLREQLQDAQLQPEPESEPELEPASAAAAAREQRAARRG